MSGRPELLRRAQEYAFGKNLTLGDSLGSGIHGSVFAAQDQTEAVHSAIKVHLNEAAYQRERNAYLRLQENSVLDICECAVPRLLGYDNDLCVIEMTIVSPPFVLDFGDASLDRPHDFSEEVLTDWVAQKSELFEGHWPKVLEILRYLEGYGIHVLDVNPGNICFDD